MNKYQLEDRIEKLLRVYRYTRDNNIGLSVGQRICLTMERAACMRAVSKIKELGHETAVPTYRIPAELNEKVEFIDNQAQRYDRDHKERIAQASR